MTKHYTDEGTLLIRNSDIKDGKFEFGDNPIYLEKTFAEKNETRMHQIGDVITVHTGDVGTSAVITENEAKSIGFATIVTRPNPKIIDSNYLCSFLNTDKHKKWAVSISTGDGRTNYNLGDYFELVVPVPSIAEQKKIASYIQKLNRLITLHQREFAFLCKEKSKKFRYIKNAWEQRKLGDVVDVRSGKDYKHLSEGNIPVYGTGGFMLCVNQALSYDEDAIGIGRKGTIDKPYILKAPFWTVDTLFYAIPREKVDLNFAFDVFQNIDWKKKDESTGVPSLSKTAINEIDVLVPQYDEQQPLGQFFNRIDNLITLHQRKYDKLTNVKKSMLEKMFPQNGSNAPEIRFKGFTEAWEQRKLSEIATMHARIGWQNLRTSEFLDSGDYMLITGTDFIDGAVNFDTCHYVERERYEQDKHIQIRNGSILITKDGTLGKVAYIQGLTMPATLNAGVFNVEIKDENEVDNRYLFQYLKAPFLMDYVDKKATGGTIKHLNQNILVDFPVVLPHKAEQEKIGEYFLAIDHLITLHQRELEKLKNLKKACLEKMFV